MRFHPDELCQWHGDQWLRVNQDDDLVCERCNYEAAREEGRPVSWIGGHVF